MWTSVGCPHIRRFTHVQPRNGQIKYAYTPDMDATARRLFRQREQAKAKRAKKKASLTSGS